MESAQATRFEVEESRAVVGSACTGIGPVVVASLLEELMVAPYRRIAYTAPGQGQSFSLIHHR